MICFQWPGRILANAEACIHITRSHCEFRFGFWHSPGTAHLQHLPKSDTIPTQWILLCLSARFDWFPRSSTLLDAMLGLLINRRSDRTRASSVHKTQNNSSKGPSSSWLLPPSFSYCNSRFFLPFSFTTSHAVRPVPETSSKPM